MDDVRARYALLTVPPGQTSIDFSDFFSMPSLLLSVFAMLPPLISVSPLSLRLRYVDFGDRHRKTERQR